MFNKKCDNCNFPIGSSYMAVGSAVEAIWSFCSKQCFNEYQIKRNDKRPANSELASRGQSGDKVTTKKEI